MAETHAVGSKAEELRHQRCKACEGGVEAYTPEQIDAQLAELPGWEYVGGEIARTYSFADYYEVMAFVNAVAYVAHAENHHPDLEVGYNRCRVRYSTHAIGGISENDFICAAKVEALASSGA